MKQLKLGRKVFRFDFQPMGCLLLGAAIFYLSERSLSFNKVMITLTSATIRIVELVSRVKGEWFIQVHHGGSSKDRSNPFSKLILICFFCKCI